jgi:hypothetical protein
VKRVIQFIVVLPASFFVKLGYFTRLPLRRGLVVTTPPDTEEIEAIGREIESLQRIGWYL